MTVTRSVRGAELATWGPLKTVYGSIGVTPGGGERFVDPQLRHVRVREAMIRYDTAISVKNRVQYDGEAWDIVDITDSGRQKQFMRLTLVNGLREG